VARDIEKENLEAHVELCAERYRRLEEKFETLEGRLDVLAVDLGDIKSDINRDNKVIIRTLIGTAGTIILALVSTGAALFSQVR
jgi:hypothetical protein